MKNIHNSTSFQKGMCSKETLLMNLFCGLMMTFIMLSSSCSDFKDCQCTVTGPDGIAIHEEYEVDGSCSSLLTDEDRANGEECVEK